MRRLWSVRPAPACAVMLASLLSVTDAQAQPAPADEPTARAPSVVPPRLLQFVAADYPKEAEARGLEAAVELQLTIDESGHVTEAQVVRGAGHGFDEAALAAARRFRFAPAEKDGAPVAVRIGYRYVFELREQPVPPAAEPSPPASSEPAKPAAEPASDETRADTPDDEPSYGAVAEVEAPAREVTRHHLDREQMTRVPGTRGDPIRAIEILPGVGRNTQVAGPLLRGASLTESQVLFEGAPVPLLYHFMNVTSFVQPRLLESVDVYPSNFSVRYGRATGGIVDVKLRDLRTESWGGMLNLSTLDVGVLGEVALSEDFAIALAGRRSVVDYILPAFLPEEVGSTVAPPQYYDYQAIAQARFGADHQLTLLGYGSYDKLALHIDDPSDYDPVFRGDFGVSLSFHRAQASLRSKLTEALEQDLMVAFAAVENDQNWGNEWSGDLRSYQWHGRGEWRVRLAPRLRLAVGLDVETELQDVAYTGPRPPPEEGTSAPETSVANWDSIGLDGSLVIFRPAAYAELSIQPTDELLLVPGVRVDYDGQLADVAVNPRFAARYQLTGDMVLKGGVGLFSQHPVYYFALERLGNPDLELYHALHTSVGTEYQLFDDMLELGMEAFYKRLFNRVVPTEGEQPPYFINDGTGNVFGAELSAMFRPTPRSFGMLAYTISRSERTDRDEPTRLFDHDQTHVLTVAVNVDLGAGWEAGGRFRFTSGNPKVPIEGAVYNANAGIYRPIYGAPYSQRKPPFHQLDLRVEKTWQFESWSLAAYLDVQNVYNHMYGEYEAYNYDYTESESTGGMPIFPNLGVRGEI